MRARSGAGKVTKLQCNGHSGKPGEYRQFLFARPQLTRLGTTRVVPPLSSTPRNHFADKRLCYLFSSNEALVRCAHSPEVMEKRFVSADWNNLREQRDLRDPDSFWGGGILVGGAWSPCSCLRRTETRNADSCRRRSRWHGDRSRRRNCTGEPSHE